MADCIDCGEKLTGPIGVTMCMKCAGKWVDSLPRKELIAMAKTGLDALIDEVSGYEKIRPKGDLRRRYRKYEN